MQILKVKTLHHCCVVLLQAGHAVLSRLLTKLPPAPARVLGQASAGTSSAQASQNKIIQPHNSKRKTTKSALERLPQSSENVRISAEIMPGTVLGADGLLLAAVKSLCLQLP